MQAEFNHIPDNWSEYSHTEKDIWFHRHCVNYAREGEIDGVREEAPEDVMQAYNSFIGEDGE